MKRKLCLLLIISIFLVGCESKNKTDIKTQLTNTEFVDELITEKVYYHNVAEYDKDKETGITHLFDKDKKLWIEYTGIVDLGIDLTKVNVTFKGDDMHIFVPKATIFDYNILSNGSNTYKIYNLENGLFDNNKLNTNDSEIALKTAQEEMKKGVYKNRQLLIRAQIRSKKLIERYLLMKNNLTKIEYNIIWDLEPYD